MRIPISRQTEFVGLVVGVVIALAAIGVGGLFLARADSLAEFMVGVFFGDEAEKHKATLLAWVLRVIAALIVASAFIVLLFGDLGLVRPE